MFQSQLNHILSADAGGFYCEHAFFLAQLAGRREGCARDPDGHALVGFLHVPDHRLSPLPPSPPHAGTLELVLRAARRWRIHRPDNAGRRPLLITGFGPFMDVADNPSGAFVADPDCVARINAVTPTLARTLSVDDEGLRALTQLIADHRPWALLSLGVTRRTADGYRVELVATDRNLSADARHRDGCAARTVLRPNYALATALQFEL